MTSIASTPRIRLTRAIYLLVLALVALSDGRYLRGSTALLAQSAGFLLVVASMLGRLWATLFIAGRKDLELVREGPYSICRHPLYCCSIVAALGIGLTTLSLTLTIALPLVVAAIVLAAARREDTIFEARHGATWLDYRDSVPAFLPSWSRYSVPNTVSVIPDIYRKAFLDAASFLGLWLLVVVLDGLRNAAASPALFHLP